LWVALLVLGCFCDCRHGLAIGQIQYVRSSAEKGSFGIVQENQTAAICVDAADWPGLTRAAGDLGGLKPSYLGPPESILLIALSSNQTGGKEEALKR
jgi:hypothetical protein